MTESMITEELTMKYDRLMNRCQALEDNLAKVEAMRLTNILDGRQVFVGDDEKLYTTDAQDNNICLGEPSALWFAIRYGPKDGETGPVGAWELVEKEKDRLWSEKGTSEDS